ncbi:MAG: T9SS type A sorting domain-containing protein [Bacteroidales bacterium]|nr:T9SS type A sorting domain-containing protein [Bacteroidales bacterium]
MNKFYSFLSGGVLIVGMLIFSSYSGGSPGGYSGSPANGGSTCTQCHSSNLNEVSDWISTDIPEVGYSPGQTYTITTTLTDAQALKAGFELSVENVSGDHMGTLAILSNTETQLKQNGKSMTHKSSSNIPENGSKSWSFNWIAPDLPSGDITFYAAFNGANGNGNNSGDQIYKTSYTVGLDDVGVHDLANAGINTYPNPVINTLTIEFDQKVNAEIGIYDLSGRIHKKIKLNEKTMHMDLSELNPGVYLISIPELKYFKRIVKK